MLEELKVNNKPSIEKFEEYDEDHYIYYRFQNPEHEIGEQSWGMIYSTPEEAIEDGSTVLDGKSCLCTAKELSGYAQYYDDSYNVLVVYGMCIGEGHDWEPLVDIIDIKEIWSYKDFCDLYGKIEEEEINNRNL